MMLLLYTIENSSDYKIMSEDMGGEIVQIIKKTKNLKFRCNKNEIHECVNWRSSNHNTKEGHPMGFADNDGKKWWIYIYCEKENYQWSYEKIQDRLIKD